MLTAGVGSVAAVCGAGIAILAVSVPDATARNEGVATLPGRGVAAVLCAWVVIDALEICLAAVGDGLIEAPSALARVSGASVSIITVGIAAAPGAAGDWLVDAGLIEVAEINRAVVLVIAIGVGAA